MVICPYQGADLHMAQLMPLPLTVSYFSKIEIDFTFLVLAHLCGVRGRTVIVLFKQHSIRSIYSPIHISPIHIHISLAHPHHLLYE